MMYMKAMTFKDLTAAQSILSNPSPALQKRLGRAVKNYDDKVWGEVRYNLVKVGLLEKFKQNPQLKDFLLKYKDYHIVEASPSDRIWGIGYAEYEALDYIDDWGENLLGKLMMDIAKELYESDNSNK